MIISASRRTDIPAYFSQWWMNRVEEGYVCVRNPFRYHQVSRVSLSPDVVDGIVFWSKNPKPFISYLGKLNAYMYYFQYTLNAYGNEVETYLPALYSRMETFRQLAKQIGKERVIWRYDPILISEKYTVAWHMEQFQMIAEGLEGYTEKCVISFLDEYPRIRKGLKGLNIRGVAEGEIYILARGLSEIAKERGMELATCCEEIDLSDYGITHSSCIDGKLIERLLGYQITGRKDKGQRKGCGCMESIDIGSYHTCPNGCVYCYAGGLSRKSKEKIAEWNGNSPVLGSVLIEEDFVRDK